MVQIPRDYMKEVEGELPRGSALEYEGLGIRLKIPCKHGHDEAVFLGKRFPADMIRRMLSNKGWKFNGKRATCPVHADNKVEGEDVTQISEAMKVVQKEKVVPIATPNAKQAKRDALRWLDESFDTVAGRYKSGMSDQKIAEETGLSAKAVAELRAEFGYDLKTPPEIAAMQQEVADVRAEVGQMQADANAVCAGLLKQVAALEQRLAKYEAKP